MLGGFIKSTDSHAHASLKSLTTELPPPPSPVTTISASLCACLCLFLTLSAAPWRFFRTDDGLRLSKWERERGSIFIYLFFPLTREGQYSLALRCFFFCITQGFWGLVYNLSKFGLLYEGLGYLQGTKILSATGTILAEIAVRNVHI